MLALGRFWALAWYMVPNTDIRLFLTNKYGSLHLHRGDSIVYASFFLEVWNLKCTRQRVPM